MASLFLLHTHRPNRGKHVALAILFITISSFTVWPVNALFVAFSLLAAVQWFTDE